MGDSSGKSPLAPEPGDLGAVEEDLRRVVDPQQHQDDGAGGAIAAAPAGPMIIMPFLVTIKE